LLPEGHLVHHFETSTFLSKDEQWLKPHLLMPCRSSSQLLACFSNCLGGPRRLLLRKFVASLLANILGKGLLANMQKLGLVTVLLGKNR
jgi:hypothetical protein